MVEGWNKTELGDEKHFTILGSGINLFEGEKDYLSTSSVANDKVIYVEQRITFVKRPSRANMQPIKDSVWFAKMKETLKVIFADENIIKNNILSTGFCGIECKDVSPNFLKHFFMSKKFNQKKDLLAEGSTQKAINNTKTATIEISFPESLQEQQKIADILTKVDETIEATENIIAKDERIKKGLMQDLFSKGIDEKGNLRSEETHEFKDSELGRIPKDWDVIEFERLSNKNFNHSLTGGPFGSDLKSSDYTEEGVRVIQLQNMGDGFFINNDFVYTSEDKAKKLESCLIYPGDLIIAKMAEPIARCCIIPNYHEKYLMCSDGIRLKLNENMFNTIFYKEYINTNNFRDIVIENASGSTRLRIGLTKLKKIKLISPKHEEQKQIASILSSIDSKIQREKQELNKLKSIKEGLMQDLLTGKVRVNHLLGAVV